MPIATVTCRAQLGLYAPLVQVEVSLGAGLPVFGIVGLPATVVKESKDRVRAALVNSGFEFPSGRITVNLSPADIPKRGGRFDLPIALGILLASEQIKLHATQGDDTSKLEFYGELGLDGELRSVPGMLLVAAHAARDGHEIVVPQANADEVRVLLGGLRPTSSVMRAADHLLATCAHLDGSAPLPVLTPPPPRATRWISESPLDLADVRGQLQAKRALTIAAAGGHSLLMIGPPGAGKSMLAMRLPGLLPPMTDKEALDVAAIASVSGAFNARHFGCRPMRTPHHTTSAVALIGGGPRARPGEISLAHHGVLFLDELPLRGTCNCCAGFFWRVEFKDPFCRLRRQTVLRPGPVFHWIRTGKREDVSAISEGPHSGVPCEADPRTSALAGPLRSKNGPCLPSARTTSVRPASSSSMRGGSRFPFMPASR